ncbi:MAG TPA: hypothetical protein VKB58_09985 [Terriglobales bacterium]|jgi:hypothetical protein|nr:hypothetical protein [Terriglobales bacterium]
MESYADLREKFERNKEDFILIEIESGITFAKLALDARDTEKLSRNRKNARRAYDTALGFLQEGAIKDEAVKQKIFVALAALRQNLLQLGEKVSE